MKTFLALLSLILVNSFVFAQSDTIALEEYIILEEQIVNDLMIVRISTLKGSGSRYLQISHDNGETFSSQYVMGLTVIDPKTGESLRDHYGLFMESSAYFVNDSLGFIYGDDGTYNYFMEILRTRDGGKTWQMLDLMAADQEKIAKGKGKTPKECRMVGPGSLAFFDEMHGIILMGESWEKIDGKKAFRYALTRDGGDTWYQQLFEFPGSSFNKRMVARPEGALIIQFAHEGGFLQSDKTERFESKDFGETLIRVN